MVFKNKPVKQTTYFYKIIDQCNKNLMSLEAQGTEDKLNRDFW